MAIADRNLSGGTRLVARYKGTTYHAEVVQTDEGLRFRLGDGRAFKSPSGAGRAVMAGKACNGWVFWSVADGAEGASSPVANPKPTAKRAKKADATPASEAAADRA